MKTRLVKKVHAKLFILGMLGLLLGAASGETDCLISTNAASVENNHAGAKTSASKRGHPMESSQIEAMILAKEWKVLDYIGALGESAIPMLSRLLENPDPQVRQLVVLCLEKVPGPKAADLLAKTINDPDEQVRAYAADILLVTPDPSILPAMLSAATRHEDPYIRAKAALFVGIMGDGNSLDLLRQALASEQNANVQNGLQQAMARLGDPAARRAILEQLNSPDKKKQFEALEKIEYVNDRNLVKNISRLLDNSSPVMVLMASETARVVLRLKDAAAKVIAVLLKQPFTFKLPSYRVCTDAEIQEIKAYLQKQRLVD